MPIYDKFRKNKSAPCMREYGKRFGRILKVPLLIASIFYIYPSYIRVPSIVILFLLFLLAIVAVPKLKKQFIQHIRPEGDWDYIKILTFIAPLIFLSNLIVGMVPSEYEYPIALHPYYENTHYNTKEIFGSMNGPDYSYVMSERIKYVPATYIPISKYIPIISQKFNYNFNNKQTINYTIKNDTDFVIGFVSNGDIVFSPYDLYELYYNKADIYIIKNETIDNIGKFISITKSDHNTITMRNRAYIVNNYRGEFKHIFNETGFWGINTTLDDQVYIIPDQSIIKNQECLVYFVTKKINNNEELSFDYDCSYLTSKRSSSDIFVGDIECFDFNTTVSNKRFIYNHVNRSVQIMYDFSGPVGNHTFKGEILHMLGYKLYELPSYANIQLKEINETTIEFTLLINEMQSNINLILADITKPAFDNSSLPEYYNLCHLDNKCEESITLNVTDDVDRIETVLYQINCFNNITNKINKSSFQYEINKEIVNLPDGCHSIFFRVEDASGNCIGENGECSWKFLKDSIRPKIKSIRYDFKEIIIEFDEDMDLDSLCFVMLNLTLENSNDVIEYKMSNPTPNDNRSIYFKLNNELEYDTIYRGTITRNAKDKAGNELEDNSFVFKIKVTPIEATPVEVTTVLPTPNNNSTATPSTATPSTATPSTATPSTNETIVLRPVKAKAYPDLEDGATIISGGIEKLSQKDSDVMIIKSSPSKNTIIFEFSENIFNMSYDKVNIHVDCSISNPDKVDRIYLYAKDNCYLGTLYPNNEINRDIILDRNRFEHCMDGNLLKIVWKISHQGIPEHAIPPEFKISIDEIYIRLIPS